MVKSEIKEVLTDHDVGFEEIIVPEKHAHVFHTGLLFHAVTDVGLEPGAKLNQRHRNKHTMSQRQYGRARGRDILLPLG